MNLEVIFRICILFLISFLNQSDKCEGRNSMWQQNDTNTKISSYDEQIYYSPYSFTFATTEPTWFYMYFIIKDYSCFTKCEVTLLHKKHDGEVLNYIFLDFFKLLISYGTSLFYFLQCVLKRTLCISSRILGRITNAPYMNIWLKIMI